MSRNAHKSDLGYFILETIILFVISMFEKIAYISVWSNKARAGHSLRILVAS